MSIQINLQYYSCVNLPSEQKARVLWVVHACTTYRPINRELKTRKLCYRKDDRAMRPMGALKIFGTPWLRPQPLFPMFSLAFVPVDPMNVPTKFEVRSFARCWDNRGYPKNWAVPGYAHAPFSEKFLMGFYSDRPYKYTRQIWNP